MPATATKTTTTTAVEIAQAWADTFQQHNLLSTATFEQRNAFIKRNIDTYNRVACPILDGTAAPQYFTPKLHANMQALMQAEGTRAKIARQIALAFVTCENIAEFTAPHCPSPRHAAAWIESLVEHAKTLRHLAAHLEEEEARASVANQIEHETTRKVNHVIANMTLATDDDDLLSPEERATIELLANPPADIRQHRQHTPLYYAPARASSVDMVEQYAARVGTATSVEIGAEILKNAADYLYSRQNGATWEHADAGDAAAVDALDDYRTVLANGNDLARITDEAGNVDLCEIEPAPSTRVVRILERLTTTAS